MPDEEDAEDKRFFGPAAFDKASATLTGEVFFASYLVHVKGEWAGSRWYEKKWQAQIRPNYSARRPAAELRQHRTCYIESPVFPAI